MSGEFLIIFIGILDPSKYIHIYPKIKMILILNFLLYSVFLFEKNSSKTFLVFSVNSFLFVCMSRENSTELFRHVSNLRWPRTHAELQPPEH